MLTFLLRDDSDWPDEEDKEAAEDIAEGRCLYHHTNKTSERIHFLVDGLLLQYLWKSKK